jgi:hypothetical protein
MKAALAEAQEFERMSKRDVRALADELGSGAADVVAKCVRFICAETKGVWHGRGRAMMCRRLKHLELPGADRDRLVHVIVGRLESGHFSEQFRDQLRLAMHLSSAKSFAAARRALDSPKDHVRRYARWVLSHEKVANETGRRASR